MILLLQSSCLIEFFPVSKDRRPHPEDGTQIPTASVSPIRMAGCFPIFYSYMANGAFAARIPQVILTLLPGWSAAGRGDQPVSFPRTSSPVCSDIPPAA